MQVCPDPDGVHFRYPVGDAVASTACGTPTPITWPALPLTVTYALDDGAYDQSLAAALAYWNSELGFTAFVAAPAGDLSADVQVISGSATDPGLGAAYHVVVAGQLTAVIELRAPGDVSEVYRVFSHELGHVLGLAHDPGETSIMHGVLDFGFDQLDPTTDPVERIWIVTDADQTALRRQYRP